MQLETATSCKFLYTKS